jgi:ribosomal protein S14
VTAKFVQSTPSRPTPGSGVSSATNFSQSRIYEQKSESRAFGKTAPDGLRPAEKNSYNDEETLNRRSDSAPPKASRRAEAPYQQADQPAVKSRAHDAGEVMDGNPYELELERLLHKQQRQSAKLEKMGRCLECGRKLGFFAKLWGLKFCKEHGF